MIRGPGLRSDRLTAFLAATVLAFALRLPFALAPGFGLDYDAWLLASTARGLAEDGVWFPSRAPGYPLVELIFAGLWPLGSRALTVATALAAASAAGFAAAALTGSSSRTAWRDRAARCVVPVALTSLPCIALPAASALDMPWALALLCAALLALTTRRPLLAGALVGVAVLARPASAVVIPALYWQVASTHGRRAGAASSAIAILIGALILLAPKTPPLALGQHWPGLARVGQVAFGAALGPGGLAALAVAVTGWALTRRWPRPAAAEDGLATRFAMGGALAGFVLFAVFPYQANYLGATVLLAGVAATPWLAPRVVMLAATSAILGGLALPTLDGLRAGPVRRDAWRREAQITFVLKASRDLRGLPASTVVSAGPHSAPLRYLLRGEGPSIWIAVPEEQRGTLTARGRQIIDIQ